MSGTRRNRARLAAVVALALVAAGLALWHWYPRPGVEPSPAMREAMRSLTQDVHVSDQPPAPAARPQTERERLIAASWTLLGTPYHYGAKGPDELDCSGFTKKAYEAIGISLPNGSFNQAAEEQPLTSVTLLAPGDLLFYRWAGHTSVSHVTIYAGDGWVIGTGTPGQPSRVTLYPITYDVRGDGRIITYRHITLSDEASGGTASSTS